MIKCGIIGYGYWGPNLARCIAEADGCVLAGIADFSASAVARARNRWPGALIVEDWREIIENTSIDAVIIATPVAAHFEMALAALRAGKHVLLEKPMTANSTEAAVLVEEAMRRNLVLMVDHTFVYTAAVTKIREIIEDGALGDIFYYHSTRINLGVFRRDVNVIWDLAVHDLAILDFLMHAEPIAVSASGAGHISGCTENMAHIALFFAGGSVAHLNVNWLAPVKIRQTLLGGSRKMILYDDLEPSEKVKVYDRGVRVSNNEEDVHKLLVSYRSGDVWAPQLSTKEALLTEIEHFVSCINTGARPLTSGTNGLRVVEMLEHTTQSLRQRGHPVELRALRKAS